MSTTDAGIAFHVAVTRDDFDVGIETARLRDRTRGRAGAIAAFVGAVREAHDGAAVEALEIEHYPGMTEQGIRSLTERLAERFELTGATVIHRVGRLDPGAQIVLVLTASPHRAAAFDACSALMDYLKTDAVLWKREVGTAGPRWVEALETDRVARARWGDD